MPNVPPDACVKRFYDGVVSAAAADPNRRIGICVSGGADSIALLLLAHSAFEDIEAATVDHGLRAESAHEAAFVARLCEERGIRHVTLALGPPEDGNLSDWARRARYSALWAWAAKRGIATLMTAHHADDQLETMIMRLNRGSGVAGLAGIRVAHDGLLRPLLGWRKAELEAIVAGCGITAVDDPSNHDDRYDRARLRKALVQADWLDPIAAARSAAALAEADAALEWATDQLELQNVCVAADVITFTPESPLSAARAQRELPPRELVRRIVLRCLARINPASQPRGAELDRLISGLYKGKVTTLCGVKAQGGHTWRFAAAPPRRVPKMQRETTID